MVGMIRKLDGANMDIDLATPGLCIDFRSCCATIRILYVLGGVLCSAN
jgi:hypothetical protein